MFPEDPRKNWTSEKLIKLAVELESEWQLLDQKLDSIPKDERSETEVERLEFLDDDYWHIVHELRTRGSDVELALCKQLITSDNFIERMLATDILGSLGYQDNSKYYEYAMQTLMKMLDDEHEHVIGSACFSLGHRSEPDDCRAIEKLIKLAEHPSTFVREGVVYGLMAKNNADAIDTLIKLCDDEYFDVRNWAIFAIGSQIETDTPQIREVLTRKLDDDNFEIRGEALVGLAERGDSSILPKLKKELEGEFEGSYALSASELLADASLLPYLQRMQVEEIDEMESYHISCLEDAIKACSKSENENTG